MKHEDKERLELLATMRANAERQRELLRDQPWQSAWAKKECMEALDDMINAIDKLHALQTSRLGS